MSENPFQVSEEDIDEMFTYADKDGDGQISYQEFQAMINPPKPPPETQKPQRSAVKRVTIQTTEPETLSVTNFINPDTEPIHEPFINNDNYHEPFVNHENIHEQFMENSWNMENSHIHLLDYWRSMKCDANFFIGDFMICILHQ